MTAQIIPFPAPANALRAPEESRRGYSEPVLSRNGQGYGTCSGCWGVKWLVHITHEDDHGIVGLCARCA